MSQPITLDSDEKLVLELEKRWKVFHPKTGLHVSMILTNQRLLFSNKGKVDLEIPLVNISEVYRDETGLTGYARGHQTMKLKLQNGEELSVDFWSGLGGFLIGTPKAKFMAITDRWVNAINSQIKRATMPETIFCKYCGARNKSDKPKCVVCGAVLT